MDVFEVSGFKSGIDRSGVNFLDPSDAFEKLENCYVYRQEILSRKGFKKFGTTMTGTSSNDSTRVMGIFENVLPNGNRELLVITKKFLYKYNSGTDAFVLIPFNARILALSATFNFGINSNFQYVSGTTYLKTDGTQRFVFTGTGLLEAPQTGAENYSAVYFYEKDSIAGDQIGDFFSPTDNPQTDDTLTEPAQGRMVRSVKLFFFGQRLNFLSPTIGSTLYNQGVLYSGIKDSSGEGDQFNVPGSGLLNCDTYENMQGGLILGDVMILNFQRSNWVLEKTRDAFNPYFSRKIPSVLGTDAPFSSVAWDYEIKSAGKTGMITTDGRQSLRFDNLIPYFTKIDISQDNFKYTYGGFYREQGQFLFSYCSSNNLTYQDKILVYNYEERTWATYDARFSVFGESIVGQNLTWNDINATNNPSWGKWNTTKEIWNEIGLQAQNQKTLAGDNYGNVYQIGQDFDGLTYTITDITKANSAVLTIGNHALEINDYIYISNVEGMTDINGKSPIVIARTDTTITVNIDSTYYATYTTGGTVEQYINMRAQTTVFNPYRDKGMRCNLSHLEFLVDKYSGEFTVEIYQNEEQYAFKTVLISPDISSSKPRQWITAIVNDEADFFTFVFKNSYISSQKKIVDFRIHSSPGGLDAG